MNRWTTAEELFVPPDPRRGQRAAIEALGYTDLRPLLAGDLVRPEPAILKRDDRQALFYRGELGILFGDSGSGKGWVACYSAAQVLRAEGRVIYIDLEDTAASFITRLRILNATDEEIADRFVYLRPEDALEEQHVEAFAGLVAEKGYDLVVIDSLGEAFGLAGINENSDAEVAPWIRGMARPFADAGAAVMLIDHVTKAGESPLHPSGTKRKRAAVASAYRVDAVKPLSAETGGRLRLTCSKDRHGWYARGDVVAELVATVDDLARTRFGLYSMRTDEQTDAADPLPGMIVEVIESADGPVSLRQVYALVRDAGVSASDVRMRDVVEILTLDGELNEVAGARGSRLFDRCKEASGTSLPPRPSAAVADPPRPAASQQSCAL